MGEHIPNEMESAKTVFEIVVDYLKVNGFDGLYNGYTDCACEVGDISPCGEMSSECQAGYRFPCNCGEHDFHIGSAEERDRVLKETEEP